MNMDKRSNTEVIRETKVISFSPKEMRILRRLIQREESHDRIQAAGQRRAHTVKIDEKILAALKEYCRKHGIQQSQLVEEAILARIGERNERKMRNVNVVDEDGVKIGTATPFVAVDEHNALSWHVHIELDSGERSPGEEIDVQPTAVDYIKRERGRFIAVPRKATATISGAEILRETESTWNAIQNLIDEVNEKRNLGLTLDTRPLGEVVIGNAGNLSESVQEQIADGIARVSRHTYYAVFTE